MVQKDCEASQGERLSGKGLPTDPQDSVCPARTHFLQLAHTCIANVLGLRHSP